MLKINNLIEDKIGNLLFMKKISLFIYFISRKSYSCKNSLYIALISTFLSRLYYDIFLQAFINNYT